MQGRPLGGLPPHRRPSPRTIAVGCICVASAATAYQYHVQKASSQQQALRLQLPRPAIDAIAGAVGEFGQILLLYPVETIKVRCQTEFISTRQVVADLAKQAAQSGGVPAVVRALFSGIGASAVLSMAVGAVHWLSFCAAKRAALDFMKSSTGQTSVASVGVAQAAPPAIAAANKGHAQGKGGCGHKARGAQGAQDAGAGTSGSEAGVGGTQHHHHLHISSLHHPHDENVDTDSVAAAAAAGSAAAAAAEAHDNRGKKKGRAKAADGGKDAGAQAAVTKATEAGEACGQVGEAAEQLHDSEELTRRMKANVFAAAVGALATALVESPVELFRHQAQAGIISGNLVKEMGKAVRRHGPGALWFGFLPFLLEAFPFDIAELATYSQLRDVHTEALKPTSRFNGLVSRLPTEAWDAAIGATAGVAAVMLSMPLDVVKTYVQTHAASNVAAGPVSQVVLFFQTGRQMVRQRGPSALFVGMVPRLLQQVPSSTICWYSVEACQKALEPFAAPGSARAGGDH